MTIIPPQYAQNVFDWEMATDDHPVFWIGPCRRAGDTPDSRFAVWKAWSDAQCMLAGKVSLAAAIEIVDALRCYYRQPVHMRRH